MHKKFENFVSIQTGYITNKNQQQQQQLILKKNCTSETSNHSYLQHEPQKNLTDVMNTFRFIAGFENTIPMKTNDLYNFGLSEDDTDPYRMKRIERGKPGNGEFDLKIVVILY